MSRRPDDLNPLPTGPAEGSASTFGVTGRTPESIVAGRDTRSEPAAADVILQCASRLVAATGCVIALHDQSLKFLSCLSSSGKDAGVGLGIARSLSQTADRLAAATPGSGANSIGAGIASPHRDGNGQSRPGSDHKILVITMNNKKKGYWSLIFVRDPADQQFQLHEMELFKSILPMFEWLLSKQISPEIASTGSVGWQILDEMRLGVVLVGPDGRVSASNRSALGFLRTSEYLMLSNGRLGMKRASHQARLPTALREISPDPPTQSRTIVAESESEDGKGSLLIRLVRLGELVRISEGRHPSIAVFISDTTLASNHGSVQLQQMFGLSRIESEVVSLICTGLAPKEVSIKLGVTENTIRGYLKSIFRKMGVHRQADLIRVISASP